MVDVAAEEEEVRRAKVAHIRQSVRQPQSHIRQSIGFIRQPQSHIRRSTMRQSQSNIRQSIGKAHFGVVDVAAEEKEVRRA